MESKPIYVTQPFLSPLEEFVPYLQRIWGNKVLIPLVELAVRFEDRSLFGYLHHALTVSSGALGLQTLLCASSTIDMDIDIDHSMRSQDKVIAFAKAVGSSAYVNPIGGLELYDRQSFEAQGLKLLFIRSKLFDDPQFGDPYVSWLSIISVLMLNPIAIAEAAVLNHYKTIRNMFHWQKINKVFNPHAVTRRNWRRLRL